MLSTCNDLASSEKALYSSGRAQWQAPQRPGQERLSAAYTRLSPEEIAAKVWENKRQLGDRLVVLGHHYQRDEVINFADFRGDSFKLSQLAAARSEAEYILFCGVHFMAESADILSGPQQQVILPNLSAGCSMADMATIDDVEACWADVTRVCGESTIPVTYMNSAANLKAFCGRHGGIVCTSSNADKVLRWAFAQGERVLFFPDQHLGRNTGFTMGYGEADMRVWNPLHERGGLEERDVKDATLLLWKGHCSVHQRFRPAHVEAARAEHPGIEIIVHPECAHDVVEVADRVGSTERIQGWVRAAAPGSTLAIGTEIHMVQRLAREHADKTIVSLDPLICPCSTMFRIDAPHLAWVLENLVAGTVVNQIVVDDDTATWARTALERMLAIT
jgi:quinolinate synthase